MNLIDAIRHAAFRNLAAPAFIFNGNVISYRQFYSSLCVVARKLLQQGVYPGDVVGLSMRDDPLHCVVILALARLGAVSVPIHPFLPLPTRERIVARYGIRTMIPLNAEYGIEGVKSILLDAAALIETNEMDMGFTDYEPDTTTPFRISLSSGSTGDPKGELFTHGYLADRIEQTLYGINSDSRVMPFDINHPMGLSLAIGVLTVGGTLVFPTTTSVADRIPPINLHGVTHIFLSPAFATQMLALLQDNGIAFPTLRHLRLVGSTPSEALLSAMRVRFTPHIFVSYGLTEVGPISVATPETLATWPRSAGKVQPWVQVEALDETGQILPLGTLGEIRVQVEAVPREYYGDVQTTEQRFRDGWFYTGDFGRVTEEGLLFIEGRMEEAINLGGPKINPVSVEMILARHPQVAEAVVFAMSSDTEVPYLFLAAALIPSAAEIDMSELESYSRQQLGPDHPGIFFIMQDFPRTPNGKLNRAEVAAIALKMRNDLYAANGTDTGKSAGVL